VRKALTDGVLRLVSRLHAAELSRQDLDLTKTIGQDTLRLDIDQAAACPARHRQLGDPEMRMSPPEAGHGGPDAR